MERPHRPPPLTIPPPPRHRARVRRSRRPNHRQARQFKRWLLRAQIANDVAHVAAASILLWIMSWFLYNVPFPLTYRTGPAAVALIIMLSTDILLDARSIVHAHDPWPGWALLLRLALGLGFIAVFAVYIALGGDVFAPDFEYWGMSDAYGRVLAYMFLWGLGLWNLLFVVLCRHWLAKEVKRYSGDARELFTGGRAPGESALRLGSSAGEEMGAAPPPPQREVDLEAARFVREESRREGVVNVPLPVRMGTRRVKDSVGGVSVSADSIASGSTSPPPVAVTRPT
ncbi:hypothetical protein CGCSCA4_v000846 [Colletotrichum siamense]|uniref:Uncharacterized protein n=1 Tax=Colletotrichum siamense TaxID=690259 RepID=A0A9P5F448_COLSI|nr:uncharacterized protein CGCS363_v010100 [Colletotrichum siamense]KAF4855871.1 hypothetical protein CGCSCA4_v000846 [Colletotrichum siamense]KAF4866324.1 hypothetical protein CGCSCA2_v000949 [Colletotrichum siamense]KAF5494434.1 hypothetical protein CGCS363_v010100 [Colletotrichum siamense]